MNIISLTFPFPPGYIRDPTYQDPEKVFENTRCYSGGLGDVRIWSVPLPAHEDHPSFDLSFLPLAPHEAGIFYTGATSVWGHANGCSDEELITAHVGGQSEIEVSKKFLHPKEVALEFGERMIREGNITVDQNWERV